MSSFKERIARLKAANAAKLAEAQAEKDMPKAKKKRLKELIPKTSPQLPHLSSSDPECSVLRCIGEVLDWKIRPKHVVKELRHGLLCTNHLVEVKGEGMLVVRHARPEMFDLRHIWAQELSKEYAFASAIGRNNLGPTCTHYLPNTETIVSRHLQEWSPLDKEKAREHYRLIMKMLNKLHGLPVQELMASSSEVAEPFNMFQECDNFLAYCRSSNVALPDNIDELYDALHRWMDILVHRPQPPECSYVVCHNDLRGENIISLPARRSDEEMQLKMIDFEFAALGDRYFDLANFSRLNDFADEEDVLLLKIYFGRFNDKQMVRLQLMKAVADLYEAMRCMAAVPFFTKHPPPPEAIASQEMSPLPRDGPLFPSAVLTENATPTTSDLSSPDPVVETEPVSTIAVDTKPTDDIASPSPSIWSALPKELAARASHCFEVFASKALNPQYTEYLAAGL